MVAWDGDMGERGAWWHKMVAWDGEGHGGLVAWNGGMGERGAWVAWDGG